MRTTTRLPEGPYYETFFSQDVRDRENWQLTTNDSLLLPDSKDRPVVTELSRVEEGQRRVVRVARHPRRPMVGSAGDHPAFGSHQS